MRGVDSGERRPEPCGPGKQREEEEPGWGEWEGKLEDSVCGQGGHTVSAQ